MSHTQCSIGTLWLGYSFTANIYESASPKLIYFLLIVRMPSFFLFAVGMYTVSGMKTFFVNVTKPIVKVVLKMILLLDGIRVS